MNAPVMQPEVHQHNEEIEMAEEREQPTLEQKEERREERRDDPPTPQRKNNIHGSISKRTNSASMFDCGVLFCFDCFVWYCFVS
jgi:hypothetical protein